MAVKPSKAKIQKYNIPIFGKAEVPENQVTAKKTLHSEKFKQFCTELGVSPTRRQAAKFNRRDGRWKETP